MKEPIIKLNNVDKVFNPGLPNEYHVLRSINLEIYPEEYIILFGPSGCGKSTLLYSILGILEPTSGEVLVKGENIYSYSSEELVRFQTKIIGIMYQAFYLIPSLNISDNVSLPLIFEETPPKERQEIAKKLMIRFGVDKQAHRLPSELSGGESQRVSVCRALVSNPEIILADEPVGNLDSITAAAVMDTLAEINEKDKKTVILVTHDAKYLPYAHRVFYLKDGNVERIVPSSEKKQIAKVERGKTIYTEIDKLAHAFPYASPAELKVKSIVSYLTQKANFDQMERLEKAVKMVVEGKIDEKSFFNVMVKNYDDGGVGLDTEYVGAMSKKISKILKESRDITRFRRQAEAGIIDTQDQKMYVEKLRKNLIEEYKKEMTRAQIKRLDEIINHRVVGDIKDTDFYRKLCSPLTEEGVGIDIVSARMLTDYIEKLIAQGVQY